MAVNKLPNLKSAPQPLIEFYEARTHFPDRDILGRLLKDPQMQRAWTELKKRVKKKKEWGELWSEIRYILKCAKKEQKKRTEEKKIYDKIVKQTNSLAQSISKVPLDDLLAYKLFPDEVMKASGVTNLKTLDSSQRSVSAHKLLKEWPTVIFPRISGHQVKNDNLNSRRCSNGKETK